MEFFFFFFLNFFSQGPNRRNRKFPAQKILLSAHLVHEKLFAHFWGIDFVSVLKTDLGQVFKNGPSKICGTTPLKHLKGHSMLEADHTPSDSLKTVFPKFYLIHCWILCPICSSKWQYLPDNASYIFLT